MFEKKFDINTADGVADAEFYAPGESGQWPGILLYIDAMGVRDSFRDMGRKFASEGFAVLLPNLYYRDSRAPYTDHDLNITDEKDKVIIQKMMGRLTPEIVRRDAPFWVEALVAQKQTGSGRIGVVGYCMSGSMALRTAALAPAKIGAAASFHGSRLVTDDPESPHTLAAQLKAKLYFGFAIEDQSMPPDAVDRLRATLDKAGASYGSDVYDGARHGWCVRDHRMYNAAQAEVACQRTVKLFKDAL